MALRQRRTRRQTPGRFKLRKVPWFDPYPHIPGTEPEKRVFAMLVEMRIFFVCQGQIPEFEQGDPILQLSPPNWKPDFILPEYKCVIDPFSPFHHSLEGAVDRDVEKVVAYAVAGYAYYHPWTLGGGQWSFDQYHDSRKKLDYGKQRIRLYGGVNADRNRYRRLSRKLFGARHSTYEMIRSIPEIRMGPMYKLTDPRDIKAKQAPGYRLGQYLTYGPDGKLYSPGATSVAAANRRRRSTPSLGIRYGTRRTIRRS